MARTPAELLVRVNVVLIVICLVLLAVCVVRGLWFPAAAFTLLGASNGYQLVTRRR
ncbi:MAG: hypothetical protein WA964_11075 [Ilumatobacter sp.]|uniref:hypothetical protein n=1 Tax=Ilumatobacter sp. TaxID=1967498 RepID=UPI003C759A40